MQTAQHPVYDLCEIMVGVARVRLAVLCYVVYSYIYYRDESKKLKVESQTIKA